MRVNPDGLAMGTPTLYGPAMHLCHVCKHEVEVDPHTPIGFRADCPSCYADLHVCVHCVFHDPGAHNQCREPATPFVRDREKFNFCTHFKFVDSDTDDSASEIVDAKAKLENMFKGLK